MHYPRTAPHSPVAAFGNAECLHQILDRDLGHGRLRRPYSLVAAESRILRWIRVIWGLAVVTAIQAKGTVLPFFAASRVGAVVHPEWPCQRRGLVD